MEHETWKIIESHPEYMVSSLGRVMSRYRYITYKDGRKRYYPPKILRPTPNQAGYLIVTLYDRNIRSKKQKLQVSRLVAKAFISNPENLPQVNHKNEDHADNRVENLEWCTGKYNCNYGTRNERLANQSYCKEIEQYSIDGKLINTFNSIVNASKSVNVHPSSISLVCRGKLRQVRGYIWKYKNQK